MFDRHTFNLLLIIVFLTGCGNPGKNAKEVEGEPAPPVEQPTPPAANVPPNLRPIPELDKLVNSSAKGLYNFRLDRPVEGEDFFVVDGLAELKFYGNVATPEVTLKTVFDLHLFSNDRSAYERFDPVESWELEPRREGPDFRFQLEDEIAIPGGLYYYIIVDRERSLPRRVIAIGSEKYR